MLLLMADDKSIISHEPVYAHKPVVSAMHGQCEARLPVAFPAVEPHRSLAQITLVDVRV